MPDITKGNTFVSGEIVTANELNALVDDAVINSLAVNNAKLAADAVTNVKVSATAAIDWSKMASLDSGKILVGNSDNQAAEVAMSGDVAIDNAGETTIQSGVIVSGMLAAGVGTVPTGVYLPYGGTSAPTGWLMCDGSAVSRTTYSALWGVLGESYGSGDGSTTFNLPDLRGRVPIGAGQQSSGKWNSGSSDYSSAGTNFSRGGSGGTEDHSLLVAEMPSHNHSATEKTHSTAGGPVTTWFSIEGGDYTSTPGSSATTASTGSNSPHNNLQPYQVAGGYIIKT